MPEGRVGVRLQTMGAEQVFRDLENVKSKIAGVSDQQVRYAKTTNTAANQARQLNTLHRQQTQIFLAQHPALNSLTRAMSTFGSISRSVLAVTSAFSLAMIAFNTSNSRLTELQANLRQVEREMALTTDPEKWRELADEAGVLREQIKEVNDQVTQSMINNMLNFGATIGIIGSSIVTALPQIRAASAALRGLGIASLIAAGPIGAIALAIAAVGFAFYSLITPGDQVADLLKTIFPEASGTIDEWVSKVGSLENIFIAAVLGPFWVILANWDTIWRGIVKVSEGAINLILAGVEGLANAVIVSLNTIFKGINAILNNPVSKFFGGKPLALIGNVTLPRVALSAANGFNGILPQDTTFMAHAGERVNITPASKVGGGGSGNIYVSIHVAGSIRSDQELIDLTLKGFKEQLKRLGFTGY